MFHSIKSVTALADYKLSVHFVVGIIKKYDVAPLFEKSSLFLPLKENPKLFNSVIVVQEGSAIMWNDNIKISCDEVWENGKTAETPFEGLMAFGDASLLWGLNESTLRKAVSYGKLVNGIDVCKFGKQWVVSVGAMQREYGMSPMILADFTASPYDITIYDNVYKALRISSVSHNVCNENFREFLSFFSPIINSNRRAYVEIDYESENKDEIMAEFGWKPLMNHYAYWKAY